MAANLAMNGTDFDKEVLQSDVPVLVDFWATWCRPCINIAPAVEEVAGEFSGRAKVYKVDVDDEAEIAMRFGIMNIPALVIFKGGQEVDRLIGSTSKENIAAFLSKHL